MPLQETSGNVTTDAYGGGVAAIPNYIEDVFSTYLYTGNGSTQTITNGIDLSGKGGLVWAKSRSNANSHNLFDTARTAGSFLISNDTAAASAGGSRISYASTGFSWLGTGAAYNSSGLTYASWTFRKQPKFFDVVTYTGTGSYLEVPHNLASVPGVVIIKKTSTTSSWTTYARKSNGDYVNGYLNTTAALPLLWNAVDTPTYLTSTALKISYLASASGDDLNAAGTTYVAYLFAHNAGGFGLTGTDNVISCGTTDGSKVTLGWEPQWILHKASNFTSNWDVLDTMRGMPWDQQARMLNPNLANAEAASSDTVNGQPYSPKLYADGFELGSIVGNHIYIAIRRGPMKVPTSGTSVYYTDTSRSAVSGSTPSWGSGFVTDMAFGKIVGNVANMNIASRLTGTGQLFTNTTSVEGTDATYTWDFMQGWGSAGSASSTFASWMFKRAPSYFDEVCYTGNGAAGREITHNLGVAPQLMIVKSRSNTGSWGVYSVSINTAGGQYLYLNTTAAVANTDNVWNSTSPSSTVFTVGDSVTSNGNARTYVAYLFVTCAGVSKVGSYTGTGTLRTIDCGFTGGARFVLIRKTNSPGDWLIWDTARGMVSGTDPTLSLNTTSAENNANSIYTIASGFQILAAPSADVNNSGDNYIYLAIA